MIGLQFRPASRGSAPLAPALWAPRRAAPLARPATWRPPSRPSAPAPRASNDGGAPPSGGGGSVDGGSGGDDDGPSLASNIWVLFMAAGAALALFRVTSRKLRLRDASQSWLQSMEWPQSFTWPESLAWPQLPEGGELQVQSREWLEARRAGLQAQLNWLQSQEWPQAAELRSELRQRLERVQTKLQTTFAVQAAPAPASAQDVAALTRLTREAFAELVKVRDRLDALEEGTGVASGGATPADATPVSGRRGSSGPGHGSAAGSQQHTRHRLSGVIRMGGGLMWAEEDADDAASEDLQAAGVKLGTDVLLQLAGLLRGGRDSVHAECRVDTAAQQLSLRKVLYSSRLGSHLRLVLAPFGARARDAAYTLNPLAGRGLASMVRDGSPLHRPVLGSLVGLGVEASRAWLSAGYFANSSADGAAACSLLAQAVVAPFNSLSLGATFVEHRRELAAGAGDAAAADADGGAGMQLPAMLGALQRFAPLAAAASAAAGGEGVEASRQLGALLAWKLGDGAVLHGWAAADGDEVEARVRSGQLAEVRPQSWGVLLGSYPDGSGSGWAFGVGRTPAAAVPQLQPNLLELSLQFNMGDGLLVTPGMLVMKQGNGQHTAFLGVKSAWTF